jgi:hypothetical protein
MSAPSFDLEDLSTTRIAEAKAAEAGAKLNMQATNNVQRQNIMNTLRGKIPAALGGSAPSNTNMSASSSSSSAPASKPRARATASSSSAPASESGDAAKRNNLALDIARQLGEFYSSPIIGPMIAHIPRARSGSLEDLQDNLKQIQNVLNSGLSRTTVAQMWLALVANADPYLSYLPEPFCIPPGSKNYCAHRMESLLVDFEQIAIEYGNFFQQSPLPRVFMKTCKMFMEYKHIHNMQQEAAAAAGEQAQEEDLMPPISSETSELRMPPPMKIYPDPIRAEGTVETDGGPPRSVAELAQEKLNSILASQRRTADMIAESQKKESPAPPATPSKPRRARVVPPKKQKQEEEDPMNSLCE